MSTSNFSVKSDEITWKCGNTYEQASWSGKMPIGALSTEARAKLEEIGLSSTTEEFDVSIVYMNPGAGHGYMETLSFSFDNVDESDIDFDLDELISEELMECEYTNEVCAQMGV